MILTKHAQIFLVSLLTLNCFILYFIFQGILPYYFSGSTNLHIIDVHIMECGLNGFFDSGYIARAKTAYNAERYKETFFLVDLIFPIIYTSLFLVLSYVFWKMRWYKWILLMCVVGMLSDLGENGSFLFYLYHSNHAAAKLTAFFTSLKSLLFPLNIILSLVLFVWGFFIREIDV